MQGTVPSSRRACHHPDAAWLAPGAFPGPTRASPPWIHFTVSRLGAPLQPPRFEQPAADRRRADPGVQLLVSGSGEPRRGGVLDLVLPGAHGLGLSDLEHRQILQLQIAREHQADILTRIA